MILISRFNNSWFNTSSNLTGQHQQIINLESNLTADDYSIAVSYNGSDDYAPSSGSGLLRVKAEIGWNISISQNWTHLGDELWINGSIFDGVYQTPILGDNISQYSIVLITEDGGNIDLAQGIVDNQTSSFSSNVTIPTNLFHLMHMMLKLDLISTANNRKEALITHQKKPIR